MKGTILFGHGSKSAEYPRPFERIRLAMLARQPEALVELGFLEMTRPTIDEAIETLAGRGVKKIVVVPIFIASGRHVLKDLPAVAANAMDRLPGIDIELASPVGETTTVIEAMAEVALNP